MAQNKFNASSNNLLVPDGMNLEDLTVGAVVVELDLDDVPAHAEIHGTLLQESSGNDVRFTVDGTDPAADHGTILFGGTSMPFSGDPRVLKFIRAGGTDGNVVATIAGVNL